MASFFGAYSRICPGSVNKSNMAIVAHGLIGTNVLGNSAGLAGSLLGGFISDRLRRTDRTADLLVSGWGLLLGMPLAAAAIAESKKRN